MDIYFDKILTSLQVPRSGWWPDNFGRFLRKKLLPVPSIKTLSLFSGAGGLDVGFWDAGFEIAQTVEIDSDCSQTLELNSRDSAWMAGSTRHFCSDVRSVKLSEPIDLIIGGPPCQPFSAAGRRAGGVRGTSDGRGTLFQEYARILRELQPKAFLFENVPGLLSSEKGKAWQQVRGAFNSAGYRIFWQILNAAEYGVPQHRHRLFVVGVREGRYLFPSATHGPRSSGRKPFVTAREALAGTAGADAPEEIKGRYGHLLKDVPPGGNYSFLQKEWGTPSPCSLGGQSFQTFSTRQTRTPRYGR